MTIRCPKYVTLVDLTMLTRHCDYCLEVYSAHRRRVPGYCSAACRQAARRAKVSGFDERRLQVQTGRIIEGDCVEVLPEFAARAALLLTSPPYDNLRDYGGDEFCFDQVADACVATLRENGVLVWVVGDSSAGGGESGTSLRQALGFMDRGLTLHDTMIYERQGVNPHAKRYEQCWEYMFVLVKGVVGTFNRICDKPNATAGRVNKSGHGRGRRRNGQRSHGKGGPVITQAYGDRGNIWRYLTGNIEPGYQRYFSKHPSRFPYQLAADHIRTWTNPGDLVIDPMCGSGTTVRAAVDLGRLGIGIEIHPEYCEIAQTRLSQLVWAPTT